MGLMAATVAGTPRPAAFLHSLAVSPEHRRLGIARAMRRWRLDRARTQLRDDIVVVASIQHGNEASLANARQWATQVLGPIVIGAAPIRPSARPPTGWIERPAHLDELSMAAARLNDFHAGHELWTPLTEEDLWARLVQSPFDTPMRQLWLAIDSSGNPLAGAMFRESFRVSVREIVAPRLAVHIASSVLRVLPRDRTIRLLTVGPMWFAPNREDAARSLLRSVAGSYAGRATHLGFALDPRGPLRRLFPRGPLAPSSRVWIAVTAPEPAAEDRPVAFPSY